MPESLNSKLVPNFVSPVAGFPAPKMLSSVCAGESAELEYVSKLTKPACAGLETAKHVALAIVMQVRVPDLGILKLRAIVSQSFT
jgi:hypothetical protein